MSHTRLLFHIGLTAIFAGYLTVWLPNELAGLAFLGIEIGEWVKFLPAVQAREVIPSRDLFYLPPITLGLVLALATAGWSNRRWQTWAQRGLAVAVSLLAFPSLEAIRFEPQSEWLLRLLMIGLVVVVAAGSSLLSRRTLQLAWLLILLAGLAGATLPTWAYLAVRPQVSALLLEDVGIGPGVWLNLAGHLLVAAVATLALSWRERHKKDDVSHRLFEVT